jgi:hypothetical protein
VSGAEVLEKLAGASGRHPEPRREDPSVRHMGPMAQDFAAAFGLGGDDRTIHPADANGVLIVALQALYRRVIALEAELATLRTATGQRSDPANPS